MLLLKKKSAWITEKVRFKKIFRKCSEKEWDSIFTIKINMHFSLEKRIHFIFCHLWNTDGGLNTASYTTHCWPQLKWLKMCTIRVGATLQRTTWNYIQNLGMNCSRTVATLHDKVLTFHCHLRWAKEKQEWINQQVRDDQRALLPSPERWHHSATKCWWLNSRLLPQLCGGGGENVCKQHHGHTLPLCVGCFAQSEGGTNRVQASGWQTGSKTTFSSQSS